MNCCSINKTINEYLKILFLSEKPTFFDNNNNITTNAIIPNTTKCDVEKVWNSPPEKYKTSMIWRNIKKLLFSQNFPIIFTKYKQELWNFSMKE